MFEGMEGNRGDATEAWKSAWTGCLSPGDGRQSDTASQLRDSLSAASEFYIRFVEELEQGSPEGLSDTFMRLPKQLFEQHLQAVGIDTQQWSGWVDVMRERPELAKDFAATLAGLQQAVAEYVLQFSEVGNAATSAFSEQQEGETAAEAFQRWMDGFDTAYQAYIRSPQYPDMLAKVVNGSAALGQQGDMLLKPWCEMNGVPEPSQWMGLSKKLEALERENKTLRAELDALRKAAP